MSGAPYFTETYYFFASITSTDILDGHSKRFESYLFSLKLQVCPILGALGFIRKFSANHRMVWAEGTLRSSNSNLPALGVLFLFIM